MIPTFYIGPRDSAEFIPEWISCDGESVPHDSRYVFGHFPAAREGDVPHVAKKTASGPLLHGVRSPEGRQALEDACCNTSGPPPSEAHRTGGDNEITH